MLKIQQVFQIKSILCVPKAQITFIRSCVRQFDFIDLVYMYNCVTACAVQMFKALSVGR